MWRRFDKRWLVFLPALAVVVLAFLYARTAVTMPSPTEVMGGAQTVEVYDRNGELIYSFGDQPTSGRVVPLEEISPYLINATIATEDAEFWDNPGVNPKGLARAVYENFAFWETGGFFKGSGGSSITQQLAKNLYIKPEDRAGRSPIRKLNETIIAFELSRRYSKEQILEWYLANVYYGNGAVGAEAASWRYFNKPPAELTLSEAALLAGLPRSPNYYEPIGNYEAAVDRQHQVLALMLRHDLASEEEVASVVQQGVTVKEGRPPGGAIDPDKAVAPHFAQFVRDELPALIGKENVHGQLRITTTLDLGLQRQAEQIVTGNLDRLEGQTGVTNGALVAMDPRTGEVLSMVGSHDFNRDDISGQVNNATAINQSGSAIKPVTYLAAFLKGWTPNTHVVDERILLGDEQRPLGNPGGGYRGDVTVRTALGSSLNVPAVKALEFAGLDSVMALGTRMGITTLRDISEYGPAFTLGADVNLFDLTYVYSVLANQGQQAGMSSVLDLPPGSRPLDPITVLKVERDGGLLWQANSRTERIVAADKVAQITDILADDSARVSGFGANSALNLPGRPAASKSGTSDDVRDAWTLGYTPQLVVGVWVGNANNAPIPGGTSTFLAAPIWRDFMLAALRDQPILPFPKADEGRDAKPTEAPKKDEKKNDQEDGNRGRGNDERNEVEPPTETPRPSPPTPPPPPPTATPPPPTNTPAAPRVTPPASTPPSICVPPLCVPTPTPTQNGGGNRGPGSPNSGPG